MIRSAICLNEIGLSNAGRADQDHILFCVLDLFRPSAVFFLDSPQIVRMIVMVANRDREDLFRLILLNHETVEMGLDVARQKIELELRLPGFLRLFVLGCPSWLRLHERLNGNTIAEVLFHELGDLRLQFFRRGKWRRILFHVERRQWSRENLPLQ